MNETPATPPATIAILAGGQSRRMGTDKALLPINGQSLIERVAARCQTLDLPLIIIANQVERFAGLGLPVYPDEIPDKGSMGGIYTALVHSQTPHTHRQGLRSTDRGPGPPFPDAGDA